MSKERNIKVNKNNNPSKRRPETIDEFLENCAFRDSFDVYTNGQYLIPLAKVKEALYYYTNYLQKDKKKKSASDLIFKVRDLCEEYGEDFVLVLNDCYCWYGKDNGYLSYIAGEVTQAIENYDPEELEYADTDGDDAFFDDITNWLNGQD